jgi:hypothetical protein
MWPPPLRLISIGLSPGWRSGHGPRPGPRALRPWRLCMTCPRRPPPSEPRTHSSPQLLRSVQAAHFYFILQKLFPSFLKQRSTSGRCSSLLRGVDQQYLGVFRAPATRQNPYCTMRQWTSPLPLGKTWERTVLTPGRIRVSAQCLLARQCRHGGSHTGQRKLPYRYPREDMNIGLAQRLVRVAGFVKLLRQRLSAGEQVPISSPPYP